MVVRKAIAEAIIQRRIRLNRIKEVCLYGGATELDGQPIMVLVAAADLDFLVEVAEKVFMAKGRPRSDEWGK